MSRFLLAAALLTVPGPVAQHFHPVAKEKVPQGIAKSVCTFGKLGLDRECVKGFRKSGSVWAGDANGDGVDELIVSRRGPA